MKRSTAVAVPLPFPVSFADRVSFPMLLLAILATIVAFFLAVT